VVGQNYGMNVSVMVANLGDLPETFNVTLYAGTTAIGNLAVTNLPNATSALTTFVWNTSGYSYGNYRISAHAWPVPGEANLTDNMLAEGSVMVTIPGDINGDFKVNLSDLVILALAYGSKTGDAKWNPNADLDNDGVIGLADLGMIAKHYGQHYP